ncbi:MAG: LPXTG cell wall anchor domain-containing protein, partial [Lachnospiraceae bacterium]|nr:LPXTG cell wall anchor domain-containing protein [Lachnospiraceae bacterium]
TPPPKTTPPVARTGDEMPLGLMLGLFGGSFLALIGIGVVYLKKKRRGEL